MRTWQTEFPGSLDDLDLGPLLEMGYIDESWHNDICPNFINKYTHLIIWCDYADSEQREIAGYKRFSIMSTMYDEDIINTDDFNVVINWLKTGGVDRSQ